MLIKDFFSMPRSKVNVISNKRQALIKKLAEARKAAKLKKEEELRQQLEDCEYQKFVKIRRKYKNNDFFN